MTNPPPQPGDALSNREVEVLALVAQGRSNARIGSVLGLAEDTIKTHMRRCFRKLGAADRAQAIAIAYQRGLLAMPWGSAPRITPRPAPPSSQPIGQPAPGSIAAHIHAAASHAPTRRTS